MAGCVPLFFLVLAATNCHLATTMLYPRASESRTLQELNDFWDFRADDSRSGDVGFTDQWFSQRLSKTGAVTAMPVPSSYNDITTDAKLRDFIGWVWYDRDFFFDAEWLKKRVVLRIDSAHYYAIVWMNGQEVMRHAGGHLPFEAEVNAQLVGGKRNYVTVAVNNTLTPTTLPPGRLVHKPTKGGPAYDIPILPKAPNVYPPHYVVQQYQFDFFNYAGIHRRVRLYVTPRLHIADVTVTTDVTFNNATHDATHAAVHYNLTTSGGEYANASVAVLDVDGNTVGESAGLVGSVTLQTPRLWWPWTMSDDYGYQYTLEVRVRTATGVEDVYRQKFGVRTVHVTTSQLLINSRPFYCHGVNKHEDADMRGKGLDHVTLARDFELMRWLGANCVRTSHYPYSEEFMDECDRRGIAVIDECPGVGIASPDYMGPESLAHHKEVMSELVARDKNRPSVIMWSVANEPASNIAPAEHYFRRVIEYTRSLINGTRPITFVHNWQDWQTDRVAQFVDILCVNRYYGWYSDMGHLEVIPVQLRYDIEQWYKKVGKPLIIAEYGADTIPGMHMLPAQMFTEEFQVDFNHEFHAIFDEYRDKFLVGELVWNFADFMTSQSTTRVIGNHKGVLTRQRQPKMAAYELRRRYFQLINDAQTSSALVTKPQDFHAGDASASEEVSESDRMTTTPPVDVVDSSSGSSDRQRFVANAQARYGGILNAMLENNEGRKL